MVLGEELGMDLGLTGAERGLGGRPPGPLVKKPLVGLAE